VQEQFEQQAKQQQQQQLAHAHQQHQQALMQQQQQQLNQHHTQQQPHSATNVQQSTTQQDVHHATNASQALGSESYPAQSSFPASTSSALEASSIGNTSHSESAPFSHHMHVGHEPYPTQPVQHKATASNAVSWDKSQQQPVSYPTINNATIPNASNNNTSHVSPNNNNSNNASAASSAYTGQSPYKTGSSTLVIRGGLAGSLSRSGDLEV
jgi:hypothetical protein